MSKPTRLDAVLKDTPSDIAHGGNPQDRAASLFELCEKLYELDSLVENVNQDELPPELKEAMDELLEDRTTVTAEYYQKINSILNLIKSKQQWAEIRQARIQELQKLVKIDRNLAVKLNKYLLEHLQQNNIKRFQTVDFNVSVAQNGGKLPLKISDNIDLESLPPELIKLKKELSTEAVRECLERGEVLGFAQYGDRNFHLRIN
jgi:Siphovirus Gp157